MPSIRQGNADRRCERDKCRELLANHIFHELGISIPPSQVRLSPALKDPYRWVIRDDQKKLFEPIFVKNLSSHSINTYRLLSNGVKRAAFRAVPIDANSNNNLSESEGCSSSIIDQIQSENNSLLTQLNQTSTLLDTESRSRQLVEETNERLLLQQQVLEQQLQYYINRETELQKVLLDFVKVLQNSGENSIFQPNG